MLFRSRVLYHGVGVAPPRPASAYAYPAPASAFEWSTGAVPGAGGVADLERSAWFWPFSSRSMLYPSCNGGQRCFELARRREREGVEEASSQASPPRMLHTYRETDAPVSPRGLRPARSRGGVHRIQTCLNRSSLSAATPCMGVCRCVRVRVLGQGAGLGRGAGGGHRYRHGKRW